MIPVVNKVTFVCLIMLLAGGPPTLTGCTSAVDDSAYVADISKLDHMVKVAPGQWKMFAQDFTAFHRALMEKDWETTYKYRTQDFQHAVAKDLYMKSMRRKSETWALSGYEILNLDMHDGKIVRVMMKYVEAPGPKTSHAVVTWKKENDGWRCEEAGPSLLSLFNRVSPPTY